MKDTNSLRWIIKNGKGQIPKIIILSVSNMILASVATALALVSKYAIDSAQRAAMADGGAEFAHYRNQIVFYGVLILAIITFRLCLRVYTQSLAIKIQASLEMHMRSNLFEDILKKKFNCINQYHSGELMNRITSDIKIITDGITTIVPNFLYFVTQFAGAFVVLIFFDWKFTMLFIAAGVVISMVTLLFRSKLKSLHKEVQETDGKVRSFFQEAIESILVVKTFGVEKQFKEKGDDLQKINYNAKMKRRRISIFANAGFSFVFNAGYLFALVWCALKVCTNAMTYGTLTAVLQLISQIQTPFVNITKVVPQYYAILASAERVMEIEDIEIEEKSDKQIDVEKFYSEFTKVKFEDIRFNYGRESVLESGEAAFSKGDFVAIRGISGIGKSTLMKMLLGVFKPQSGHIRLYKENGKSVEASPDTRCLFSYVPQGNYLFSGTLRENILLINPNATEEQIKEALEISDIYNFVKTLPNGLDTIIGEKGLGISEGQAQRLAIARALLSEAPILLLDEATSALDAATEQNVLERMRRLNRKTCIIITHKAAALDVCNKEFVIDNKKLYCIEK
ncbi:ABC transporter ATP-binding protein [uncultured Eubacterium sp.]|uniref:ABC transporter ATP-binding protein n=1 Tax=uncultured Eubacterium sp. TaxID=165185 RepID=UPI0026735B5B|nr:ABC transporter ATP-binding protein [uncultured Eubacterium sp.]